MLGVGHQTHDAAGGVGDPGDVAARAVGVDLQVAGDHTALTLEFIQINHPGGTSSYFRKGAGQEIEAGPFGGGYSWTVPKYVVKAAHDLFFETFKEEEAECLATAS